jgi:long-chain acyl-CoA synthetase
MQEKSWYKHWPVGQPRTLDYPDVTVDTFLRSSAYKWPNRVAVIFEEVEYTFAELWDKAQRFASALADLGVDKGDVVAMHMPNCPQFFIAYYGILLKGAVYAAMNPRMSPGELENLLKDCRAEVIITYDLFAGTVSRVRKSAGLKHVIITSGFEAIRRKCDEKCMSGELIDFQSLLDRYPPTPPQVSINPREDLAHLAYTGGTTGVPKGVMLTHRNVTANVIATCCWLIGGRPVMREGILYLEKVYQDTFGAPKEFPIESGEDVVIGVVPLFHTMGVIGYLNVPITNGITTILPLRFDAVSYLDMAEKYRATLLGGPPQLYLTLLNTPGIERRDLQSVKAISSGAAPLPVELGKRLQEIMPFAYIIEAYGLTEVTTQATSNPANRLGLRKIGSVGIPIYDTEVKIVDTEIGEKELPSGQYGEICIKGPQVMLGYYNRPEETAAVLRDGWLYTGDIGVVDEDGYITIVDRKKDMLIYKGYNVYPKELEEILFTHQAVASCAVIGVADELVGEFPKAFVVKRSDAEISAQELMDHVNSQVIFYKKIRELEFIGEIPVSPTGKVLKRELRARENERRKASS